MQTLTQAAACLALPLSSAPSGREISILDAFHLLWTYARSGKELSHLMRFTDTRCCTGTCGNQCPPPPQIHMQSMSETLEVEIALFLIIVKPEILEVIQLGRAHGLVAFGWTGRRLGRRSCLLSTADVG